MKYTHVRSHVRNGRRVRAHRRRITGPSQSLGLGSLLLIVVLAAVLLSH